MYARLIGFLTAAVLFTTCLPFVATGQFRVPWTFLGKSADGTTALPSIKFRSDLDTGMYRVDGLAEGQTAAGNALGVATGGTRQKWYDAIGGVHIHDNVGARTDDAFNFQSSGNTIFPIDWWYNPAHQRVALRTLYLTQVGQIPDMVLRRAEGTYPASPSNDPNPIGTAIGVINFAGHTGTSDGFQGTSVSIIASTAEVPSTTTSGGVLRFFTAPFLASGFSGTNDVRAWFGIQHDGSIIQWSRTSDPDDSRSRITWSLTGPRRLRIGQDDDLQTIDINGDIEFYDSVASATVKMAYDGSDNNLTLGGAEVTNGGVGNLIIRDGTAPLTLPAGISFMWSAVGIGTDSALFLGSQNGEVYRFGSGMIALVGTTSAFPAIKRSGTIIQARLADDSGFAQFESDEYKSNGLSGVTTTLSCDLVPNTLNLTVTGGIITAASCT